MHNQRFYKETEKQISIEKMAYVRSFKKVPETIGNKIKRCSENNQLVKQSKKAVRRINRAFNTILESLDKLEASECAWSLSYRGSKELFDSQLNLPDNVCNQLREIVKLQKSLQYDWYISDAKALDLLRSIRDRELIRTTLKIIEKEGESFNLNTVISTIKRIHVYGLTNLRINQETLDAFCRSRYVKKTRPETSFIYGFDNCIHQEFENKLDPSLLDYTSSQNKGFGLEKPKKSHNKKLRKGKKKRR